MGTRAEPCQELGLGTVLYWPIRGDWLPACGGGEVGYNAYAHLLGHAQHRESALDDRPLREEKEIASSAKSMMYTE